MQTRTSFDTRNIKAILFDMNGTLRQRIPDAGWQRESSNRLFALMGLPGAPAFFMDELNRRYKAYTQWADEHGSCSEGEIWTRWIAPEMPRGRIESRATELMFVWQNRKGPAVLKPNALPIIEELSRRSYRLGVVSNTTGTTDLPVFIEQAGLGKYFEAVVLSAVAGCRKPKPEIFWQATQSMNLDPAHCAYLGNKPSVDVVGARRAGLGLSIIIEPPNTLHAVEGNSLEQPDMTICDLSELLELFPSRAD